MKLALPVTLTALTTIVLPSLIFSCPPAWATNYGELEVNQNQFIAVAVPFGRRQYNLMIIEQIDKQPKCWSESGSQPVTVEPLLLNFDFSGICRRATDSNGYSMRIQGQDYGLNYLLSIVEREGELLLLGTPRVGEPNLPEVLVGRSYGLNQGWSKILLNPGWRFTKRTFEAQTLGHIYLTNDRAVINYAENTTFNARPIQAEKVREIIYTAPDEAANRDDRNNDADSYVDKLLVPDIPIPVLNQDQFPSFPVAGQLPAQSYRVIVKVNDSSHASQVRSLYPQAFLTFYQGQSILQIGSFSGRQDAENTLQNLQNLGWEGIILEN